MKRRYLLAYINPDAGRESLGTGPEAQSFQRYASVENVLRFGLVNPAYPVGQYNLYSWLEGSSPHFVRTVYKRV